MIDPSLMREVVENRLSPGLMTRFRYIRLQRELRAQRGAARRAAAREAFQADEHPPKQVGKFLVSTRPKG